MRPPPELEPTSPNNFLRDLTQLLNSYSLENNSDTPDFILAQYLISCLDAYDFAVRCREKLQKYDVVS